MRVFNVPTIFVITLAILRNVTSFDWTLNCSLVNCKCKWINGKKSAICNALSLTQIPSNLSTEIQVLMLNDNNIQILNREEFTKLGLINLQKIYLKKSNIKYLHKETFKNLKILVELDISLNLIEQLEKQTFSGNDRLRILYLYGNPIKRLQPDQFPVLPYLRTIDLHSCEISYIDETAFSNVDLLEYLNLNFNKLESLPGNLFTHMKNLKTLLLEENPWSCDCKLKKFRNWYINYNRISLQCKTPAHMEGLNWENADESQFGCAPSLKILKEDINLSDLESNITFKCYGYGDPKPQISWEMDGKDIENDNVIIDNSDEPAQIVVQEQQENVGNKIWSNLSIYNITNLNAGHYTCFARNGIGYASQNISLILPEIVDHVLIKNSDTFWYFGLILGIFGTIISFLLIAISFCICKKFTRKQRARKNIKNSVSFNDQEKKLLDLSITTTNNDRNEYSDLNTPSTTTTTTAATIGKNENVIALEPVQITIENFHHHPHHRLSHVDLEHHQRMADEYPLNISLFPPPPPEFCSSSTSEQQQQQQQIPMTNPYGNIFISVSVSQDGKFLSSQDATDSEMNMYPDLLNIPKNRVKNSLTSNNLQTSSIVPINIIESYATLPRKLVTPQKAPVSILKQTNYDRCIMEEPANLNLPNDCVSCGMNNQSYEYDTNIDSIPPNFLRVTASGALEREHEESHDQRDQQSSNQPTSSSSPISSQLSSALLIPNGNDFVSL